MVRIQSSQLPAALLLLASLPIVVTHTHGNDGSVMAALKSASTNTTLSATNTASLESYFAYSEHGGLMLAHIVLMTVAWVFVLPIGEP